MCGYKQKIGVRVLYKQNGELLHKKQEKRC